MRRFVLSMSVIGALTARSAAAQEVAGPAAVVIVSATPGASVDVLDASAGTRAQPPWSARGTSCQAPCRLEVTPGLHALRLHGPGISPREEFVELPPGETRLSAKSGHYGVWLTGALMSTAGVVGTLVGGAAWIADADADSAGRERSFGGAGPLTLALSLPVLAAGLWLGVEGSSSLALESSSRP